MRRIIKKILRIILVLMLIVSLMTACTYKAYAASAAGVVVAGGSIGTGGVAAGLLGLMGPVTAILGVALAAYGISVVLDESSEAEGMTKTDFIMEQATKYNQARDMSNAAMIDIILQGASVLKNGAISISHTASSYINGFINYLFASDQVISPDSISGAPSSVVFDGLDIPVLVPNVPFKISSFWSDFYIKDTPVYRSYLGVRFGNDVYFLSNIGGIFQTSNYSDSSFVEVREGLFYCGPYTGLQGNTFPNVKTGTSYVSGMTWSDYINSVSDDLSFVGSGGSISSLVGDENVFNDRAGTLSPSADENTVFTPPLVGALPGTGSVSISDYLDTIIDLLNEGEADIPIADPVTDVVSNVAVTDVDLTDSIPSVDTTEDQDNVGSTSVVDSDVPLDPDVDTVNSLAFDLREIFPFCIPFDLYNLLSKFVAEPEAPYWEISIPMPLNLPAFEFVIDFSGFESVGVVLRSFEMVLFVASLAVATRSIYLRG